MTDSTSGVFIMVPSLLLCLLVSPIIPQQPSVPNTAAPLYRYTERQMGAGKLSYHGNLAVLSVSGTPQEMGQQLGTLLKPELVSLHTQADDMINRANLKTPWTFAKNLSAVLAKKFPESHRQEMEAVSQASGFPVEMLYTAHLAGDLLSISGCSDVVIEPARSATGNLLFGRNMDFNPAGFQKYALLAIYHSSEPNKHAFAHVTYPGLLGISTGMNDAGLCVGHNSIYAAADGALPFSTAGCSSLLMTRRILEECSTVEEAMALAKKTSWAGRCALMLADTKRGMVLEITTKNVLTRETTDGLLLLTNHLRCPSLAPAAGPIACSRFQGMQHHLEEKKGINAKDVLAALSLANQGGWTIQSVQFTPATLQAQIALGNGVQPATARQYELIDLKPLLKK